MKWYKKFINKKSKPAEYKTFYIKEEEDITDEIEKSLWIIKDVLDLPTEEIERSVESRKSSKRNKTSKRHHNN